MNTLKSLATIGLLVLAASQSPSASACDVVKLYADLGPTRFAASGFTVKVKGTAFVITADHFLPVDRVDFPITAFLSKTDRLPLVVKKRDWGSDLLILSAKDEDTQNTLNQMKACPFSNEEPSSMEKVTLLGYPSQDFDRADREGILADTAAREARISRPLRMLKILSLAEKGMSGGVVVNSKNELLGLIQSEWTSMTESSKGGAYALFARDLARQLINMLSDTSSSIEMPLPFRIRRAEGEIQFGGFRIHDRPESAHQGTDGAGGGHPDGIGGELPDAGVEIVGLTGEKVPEEFRAMEQVLRNIQSRGGVRMVVRGTDGGQPIRDMIALGRLLLISEANPELDYSLIDVTPNTPTNGTGTPEALMEEAIVLISLLNNVNPGLKEYSQLIKATYEKWLKTKAVSATKDLFDRESQFQPELDRILDLAPELWNKVVDLQSTLLLLKKSVYLSR